MNVEKDLQPDITDMQDIMRNIKKKKNDLYDKTTLEFVEVLCYFFPLFLNLSLYFFLSLSLSLSLSLLSLSSCLTTQLNLH